MDIAKLKEAILEALKPYDRLWDESNETLNQTLLLDLVESIDEGVISLLFSKNVLREKFFVTINGATIFKSKDFRFFMEENKIDNSYTQYRNRIGLSDGERFLKDSRDVVLNFPYKDCVLEGGQTKEDTARKEIFFNEVLAQDEIDRLFDKKAFVNWNRHDASGAQAVDEIKRDDSGTIRENMIIKGNNLLALHSLKEQFTGKVKLIYIDPPYNTDGGSNTFAYNNTFNHSSWLTFMKNRLETAKRFLRDDGFIAITIDLKELFYLGVLADEVFNVSNRIGVVTIEHNPKGRNQAVFFSENSEFMLVYAKNKSVAVFNKVAIDEEILDTFDQSDSDGKFRYENYIRARNDRKKEMRPDNWYPIYVSQDLKTITSEKHPRYHEIYPITKNGEFTWKNIRSTFDERNKGDFFKAEKEDGEIIIYHKYREQQVFKNVWTQKKYQSEFQGTKILNNLIGKNKFSYPKSLYAVLDTLKIMTSDDDIILDFFAGSGTTAHATLALNKEDGGNRQFILCEQMDYIKNVTFKRVQEAMKKANLGGDFLYFELAKWNEQAKEEIKACKDLNALIKIFDDLCSKYFLHYNFEIKDFKENKIKEEEFKSLSLDEQKQLFHAMLDLNQMYVCSSEMADSRFAISAEDQKLTSEFYDD